jgi:Flp pilus assembly protein TadG
MKTVHDERGISALLIAILGVVLISFAAFVLDTGALYTERRELQVGADAGALAVAMDCARNSVSGPCGSPNITADGLADLNASVDGQSTATAAVNLATRTVVVVNRTKDTGANIDGNSQTVDFHFAPIFGQTGEAVSATATATWSYPSGAVTLPLTFSLCEWNLVGLGAIQTGNPPYPPALARLLYFHDPGPQGATQCNAPAGQDFDGDTKLPGGFGWLDSPIGCSATVNGFGWVPGSTGSPAPNTCNPADLLNKTVLMPIFDDVAKSPASTALCGGNRCYHVYGYAGFYISGFNLTGQGPASSWNVNAAECTPTSKRCIKGFFVSFVTGATAGSSGGGINLGAATVKLTQ